MSQELKEIDGQEINISKALQMVDHEKRTLCQAQGIKWQNIVGVNCFRNINL